jgi:integrase/recombinase XerD
VDLARALISVTDTKRKTGRRLPLHPSTVLALRDYVTRRDQLCPLPRDPAFLLTGAGVRLDLRTVQRTFTRLVARHGIARPPRGPGLKDFRHTLAVTILTGWYADGGDVTARLPLLSAWLGHRSPASTYWYITTSPELLAAVTEQMATARDSISSEPS